MVLGTIEVLEAEDIHRIGLLQIFIFTAGFKILAVHLAPIIQDTLCIEACLSSLHLDVEFAVSHFHMNIQPAQLTVSGFGYQLRVQYRYLIIVCQGRSSTSRRNAQRISGFLTNSALNTTSCDAEIISAIGITLLSVIIIAIFQMAVKENIV